MIISTKDGIVRQTNIVIDTKGNETLITWEYNRNADLSDIVNWRLIG